MTMGDRVRALMADQGMSQSELARRVGVSQQAIHSLLTRRHGSAHVHKIARALQTSPAYLTGETEDPKLNAIVPVTAEEVVQDLGLQKFYEVDLRKGLGRTEFHPQDDDVRERWIPAEWIAEFTPARLDAMIFTRAVGESMAPWINDRDTVIIDRSIQDIDRQDDVWALIYGGVGMIRRVRMLPNGSYRLMADNPQVHEEAVRLNDFKVAGRVAGVIRRM